MSDLNPQETLRAARAFLEVDPDAETRAELSRLIEADDLEAIHERFRDTLRFGTAGLRGRMGAGTMRMNRVVVRRATHGLGMYLNEKIDEAASRGVVVAFDGRKNSRQFAEDAANVLGALGIRVHLFPDPVPTPVCAFAVSSLNAAAGIMVTASHNPPADNGYKVYWENGAQIIPPHDAGIAACIARAPASPSLCSPFEAAAAGLRVLVDDTLEARYLGEVARRSLHDNAGRDSLSVVFTAMHGVGNRCVMRALSRAGFAQVIAVPAQADPDGVFPTVKFPNPEEPGALDLALGLAAEHGADLVLANDPDADRISVSVRTADGFRTLTGNDVGVLLGADAIEHDFEEDARQKLVITTIVSSTMLSRVAKDLGAAYAEVLTGFKWIANEAIAREAKDGVRFVCGYEEALGVSVSDLVRDKDGVSAAVRVAELAAFEAQKGRTLLDRLDELALKHGLSASEQWSVKLAGAEGAEQIATAMQALRDDPPAQLGTTDVARKVDLNGARAGWEESPLPASDVVVFYGEDDTRLTVRPSGTEPKIKFYLEAVEWPKDTQALTAARATLDSRLALVRAAVSARLGF